MKRMLAFLLCWTMLLSQLVMLAEAAKMQDQSDIFYLEENGIHVEDGAEVVMDQTPLGKSEPTDRYSPSVPKFVPEALRNLGIEARTEEPIVEEEVVINDAGPAPEFKTYTATIKSDKVMMYAFPRSDAESVYLYNCGGLEVELYSTDSAVWYRYNEVNDVNNGAFRGYSYIYADDVILHDLVPKRGIVAKDETGFAAEIKGAPAITEAAVRKVDPSRAPTRTWVKDGGVRTLIASYDISVRNPDRSAWQPVAEPVEVFLTLPEVPEMGRWGSFYVEYLDAEGVKQTIVPTKYFLSNVISFETDYLTEVFIYTLDYPEDTDIIFLDPEIPVQFSYLYDLHDMSDRPFTDLENVTVSDPEKIKVEWFYDTEAKRGDWLVTLLEQTAQAERFILDFADNVPESRADHYYSAKGDFPNTLTNGNHYWVDVSFTHDGNLLVGSGTVTITFGEYKGAGKTLTVNGYLGIGDDERVNFTINNDTSSNSVFRRAKGRQDSLVYVNGTDKSYFVVYGAASRKLIIDGYENNWCLGALVRSHTGRIYLENCYIRYGDNSSTHNDADGDADSKGYPGGGIYCGGATKLYIGDDVQIYGNTARQGGGIYLAGGAVADDWNGQNGGAEDNKPDIKNNSADVNVGNGGGIYLAGTAKYQAYIGNLNGNSATGSEGRGGGVMIGSDGVFKPLNACTITSNSAKYGGGIYKGGSSNFAPGVAVDFNGNSASVDGGGLYLAGGTYTPADGTDFYSNKADSGHGGGIYVNSGTLAIASEFDIGLNDGRGNTAKWGAGIYVKNGTFNGAGLMVIRYNTASQNGGGLMVEGGTLTISGAKPINIGYNTATNGYGGGINVYDSGTITDSSTGTINVYGNTAKTYGGGVYLNGSTITTNGGFVVGLADADGVEKGNFANWGSGMCIWTGGTFTYSDRVIVQNNDKDGCTKGGGIYLYGGTITCSTTEQLDVFNNKADYGGGIYIGGSTDSATDTTKKSITFNGTGTGGIDVYNNTGDTNGGGIMAENCTWTNATPLTVRSNTTPGNGGGININGWVNRVTFTSSKKFSVTSNTATGNGGGIWNNSDMTITADVNCSVESNTATGNGGGIYNNGGTLTFNSKYFVTTNTAQDGGGIYHNAGTIQLNIDISIRTNTAKGNGGGIYSKSTFNMTKGAYVGSWAVAADNLGNKAVNGAGIFLADKTFTVDGTLSMGHNIASNQGGGIYIQGGTFHQKSGTLKLGAHTYSTSTAVAGNEANAGGGLCMTGGTFKCEGTLIMNGNKAKTGNGGGILAENATSVSITGTGNEIKNNTAQVQGGAMRCYNTNTTVKNATIDNNTATNGHAGGLIVFRGDGADGTLTLENCNITNNKCLNSHGQGINGNTTADDDRGAGIYAQAINLSVKSCTITGNTTPYGVGGGIYFNSAGKNMTITSSTISNNEAHETNATNVDKAGYGGGIYILGGNAISITGSTIAGNKSDDYGGGIYIHSDIGSVKIETTTIGGTAAANGNKSGVSGGGIYTKSAVTISGGSVSNNTAHNQGGGIYLAQCDLTVSGGTAISSNKTETNHGGGIYSTKGNVTLGDSTKVQSNEATTEGGGIYFNGGSGKTYKLTVGASAIISSNKAKGGVGGGVAAYYATVSLGASTTVHTNTTSHSGGGVYLNSADLALNDKTAIYNNTAENNGGGIHKVSGSITISGSPTIYKNNAKTGNGGGIYSTDALTLSGTLTVGASTAANGNSAGANGGGIYAANTLSLTSVTVQNNKAVAGGGIYAANTATLSGTKVLNNSTTTGSGGGIYLTGGSSQIKSSSQVNSNTSGAHGGGIYMTAGSITVDASTIDSNSSASNGAGLCMDGTSIGTVTLQNKASISSNKTTGTGKRGGGVWMKSGTLNVKSQSTISKNHATQYGGGIYMDASGTVTVNTASVANNTSGDNGCGICMNGSGTKTLNLQSGAAVTGNVSSGAQGGGLWVNSSSTVNISGSTEISSNQVKGTSGLGGGIYLTGGTVNVTNSSNNITGNTATGNGGGIYLGSGKLEIKSDATLTVGASGKANTATDGGGIYLAGGTLSNSGTVNASYNTASTNGGGIYYNNGTLTQSGTLTISHNTATSNGGGIYTNKALTLNGNTSVGYMDGTTRHGNFAASGAGIYVNGVTLTLGGAKVQCNRATLHGGGIYAAGAAVLASANFGNVKYNEAGTTAAGAVSSTGGSGGGVFLGGTSKMTIGSGSLSNNKARGTTSYGNGAGIYVDTSAELTLAGGSVSTNESIAASQSNGGTALGAGIYTKGTVNVTGNFTVNGNTTNRYGAGIYLKRGTITISSGKTLTVNGTNTAGQYGGGIVVNNDSTNGASITGDGGLTVSGNTATSGGGGIYMDGTTANGVINVKGTVEISKNTTDGYGGGVCLTGSKASFAPTGTMSIYENSAKTHGGGVYVSNGSFAPAVTGHLNIRDNTAGGNGAGVYYSGGTFNPTGDVRIYSNTATGNGGGIYTTGTTWTLASTVKVCLIDSKLGNTAKDGGGIYVNSGSLTLNGSPIYYNTATQNGGGLYLNSGSVTYSASAHVDYNKATGGSGGGIYLNGGTLSVTGSARLWVEGNTASVDGGGIYITGTTTEFNTADGSSAAVTITTGNVATRNGGGIYQANGKIKLLGSGGSYLGGYGAKTGNTAVDGGGAYLANGTFEINPTIQIGANTATDQGGAFYIGGGSLTYYGGNMTVGPFVYSNVTTAANTAKEGGGIYIASGSMTVNGTATVNGNTASTNGGGIYINGGSATVNSGKTLNVNNNKAVNSSTSVATSGGGIYMAGGTITNNGAMTVSSNVVGTNATTNNKGGGVYLASGTFTTVGNLHIYSNQAYDGGGIFLAGGVFETKGTAGTEEYRIKHNTGVGTAKCSHGAGIHAQGGTIRVNSKANLCVYRNYGQWGPGVFFGYTDGSVTIDGSGAGVLWVHENHDTEGNGSAIWIESCTVEMKHATSINRQVYGAADKEGENGNTKGAIRIQKNNNQKNKGILNVSAKLLIENCQGGDWSGGITMKEHAELNVLTGGTLTITGCSTTANGGAIQNTGGTITNAGTMTIGKSGGANSAANGGGIYVSYDSTTKTGSLANTGTMNVSYNTATSHGGGVYLNTTATLSSTGGMTLNNNGATSNGGGLYINSATLNLSGTNAVHTNTATSHGGGIFYNGGTITVSGTTGTTSIYANTATKNGGGIYANAALTIDGALTVGGDTAAKGNKAVHGGGIFGAQSVNLTDATIQNNQATTGQGGGFYMAAGKTLTLNGTGKVDNNYAKSHGGGMYLAASDTVDGASLTFGSSASYTVANNKSDNCGGGIIVFANGSINAANATKVEISGNTAASNGAGVYMTNATFSMAGGVTIHNNTASGSGGGIFYNGGTISISGSPSIYTNSAVNGGGIYANTALTLNGSLTIGGTAAAKGNEATTGNGGGIYAANTLSLTSVTVRYNKAVNGGGVYATNATTCSSATLNNNTASTNGGGLYLTAAASLTSTSTNYDSNTAVNGGGIYSAGATLTFTTTHSINGNTASNKGGGIYMLSGTMNLNTSTSQLNVFDNKARFGGGLYLGGVDTTVKTININGEGTGGLDVYQNYANQYAGDSNGGGIMMECCTVNLNQIVYLTYNDANNVGGGIYVNKWQATTTLNVNKSFVMRGNTATNNGGGMNVQASAVNIASGVTVTIDNTEHPHTNPKLAGKANSAANGGGIYLTSGTITNNGTLKVNGNTATANGGGIYLAGGTLDNKGVLTVDSNKAAQHGGGIYTKIALTLNAVTVGTTANGNVAGGHGGGIYCDNVDLTLSGKTAVTGNYAGSVVNTTRAVTIATSATGGDGGGIYFDGAGKTLTLDGVTISYNTANASGETNGNGGGIYMVDGELKTSGDVNTYVQKNTAENNGGGIYISAGVVMTAGGTKSVQILENTATNGNGGGIYNAGAIHFNMRGQVNVNTATNGNGGGIYNTGTVTATGKDAGVSLQRNTAGIKGGGIYMAGGSFKATAGMYVGSWQSAEANNGVGNGNRAIDGAGIYQADGTFELENLQMGHNIASGNGGGMYITGGSMKFTGGTQNIGSFFYDKATVPGNQAVNGAGIYLAGGSLDVSGSAGVNIGDNVATNKGGGIYTMVGLTLGSVVKVGFARTDNGTALNLGNYAVDGAGIYVEGKTLTLGGAQVKYNVASNDGGGIYMQGGVLNTNGTSIGNVTENYAGSVKDSNGAIVGSTPGGNGGGIYLGGTAQMTMNGGTLSGNYAKCDGSTSDNGLGGGLYVGLDAKATLKGGGTITGNYATATEGTNTNQTALGGGVYSRGEVTFSGNFTISGNHAYRYGGGYYHAKGKTTVSSGTVEIKENGAQFGAGLDISEGTFEVAATLKISANIATSDGGGICMDKTGTFQGSGTVEITANQARHGGGVVLMNYKGASGMNQFIPTGKVTITDNTATGNGGGIAVKKNEESTTQRIVTMKNVDSLIARNTAGSNGGGIHMEDGTVTLTDVHVESNYAVSGGGIYAGGGTVTLNSAKVQLNRASQDGGGIYMSNGAVTLTGGTIDSNYATNGGGAYVSGGTLTLNGATVSNHTKQADKSTVILNGGGIYMSGGTTTLDQATVVTGNQVVRPEGTDNGGNGGGIFASGGTLKVLGGSEIYENTASFGAGVFAGTTTTVTGSYIRNNTSSGSGGGIFVSKGTTTVNGASQIYSNTAPSGGGVRITSGSLVLDGASAVMTNTSTGDGGGISMKGGTVTVQGASSISSNTATKNGGGAWVEGGTLELTGGSSIKSNTAANGGGVFISGGTLALKGKSVIESNTASQHGGGVRYEGGTITLPATASELVEIRGNTASSCGGGIYAVNKALTLDGHLLIGSTSETNGNQAKQGGGIYANTVDLTLNGVKVNYNKADEQGGGIKIHSGNVTLDGGAEVSYNKTTTSGSGGTGGGIYAISSSDANKTVYTVKVLNATMKGNRAFIHGGAIIAFDVDIVLGEAGKKATLTENYAESNGGAIYILKHYVDYGSNPNYWLRPEIGAPTLRIVNADITGNTAVDGGAIRTQDAFVAMSGGNISGNTARSSNGGGIYFANHHTADTAKAAQLTTSLVMPTLTIEGGTITKNKAINAGGGIYLGSYGELVMTKAAKSPVFGNTADVEGNDLYAVGDTTTVTIRDTMDGTAEEYWFADYALDNAKYPGKPTFPSDYTDAKGAPAHLGRYASNKTPITFARRSFGAAYDSKDDGALEASTATLALTLGLEQKLFMNLTLEKKLKLGETAVEDTTFIFYVKGLDNADFLLPVMIHLKKGEIAGSVTIRDLPMGIYDVCEDESWSWRYAPTNVAYSDNGNGMAYVVDDGDDYVRIKGFTAAGQTCTVTFTNGLDISRCRWLTDGYYFLPTKLTRSVTPREDDEDETE